MGTFKFRKTWRWPGEIEDFIRSKAEGYIVHVCSGDSELGDLKIDLHTEKADIKASFMSLPLETGIADTVICDPPWEIPYNVRSKMIFELRRVLKVGGILIFDALWLPHAPGLVLEEIWVPDSGKHWTNVSLISIYRKTRGSIFGDR